MKAAQEFVRDLIHEVLYEESYHPESPFTEVKFDPESNTIFLVWKENNKTYKVVVTEEN